MRKIIKIIGVIILAIIILLAALLVKMFIDQKKQAEDQKAMIKTDAELLGVRFQVPRDGKAQVDVNLYIPENSGKLPVIFNIHGGAFIGGNADALDTQSDRLSREWNAAIVTVQYKLALDGITIDDAVEEVADTILYFKAHAEEYGFDPNRFVVMGYSAGGYHALAAVIRLKGADIDVAAQVLCYPYIRDADNLYASLTEAQRATIAPALFVLADNDPIGEGGRTYEALLHSNGIQTEIKKYDGALHGFIEENNPEYEKLNNKQSKSPEQEEMARDAEAYIGSWLEGRTDTENRTMVL